MIESDQRIDPDGWYSANDLFLQWNLSPALQEQARESGRLKFTQFCPSTFLYRGSDVLAWLESQTSGKQPPAARKHLINPQNVYNDGDLRSTLEISQKTLDKARQSKQLCSTEMGLEYERLGCHVYSGEAVLAWLENDQVGQTTPAAAVTPARTQLTTAPAAAVTPARTQVSTTPASGSPAPLSSSNLRKAPVSTPTYQDPVAEWNRRVDEKTQAGMTKQKAIRAVATQDPGLHQAMLVRYNQQHGRAHAAKLLSG